MLTATAMAKDKHTRDGAVSPAPEGVVVQCAKGSGGSGGVYPVIDGVVTGYTMGSGGNLNPNGTTHIVVPRVTDRDI